MESSEIGIVTPDWLVNSLENKSLLPTADFHPDLLESVKDSPPRQSALDPSDDTVLEDLHTLLPSDFDDLLNSTPTTTSSLSSSSTTFSSTANALDITASISAVIAHSVQMEQQKKAAELERSNSRPSSGTDSNSQGMVGPLIDWLIDWLIESLFRMIDRAFSRSVDWLINWVGGFCDWSFDWLIVRSAMIYLAWLLIYGRIDCPALYRRTFFLSFFYWFHPNSNFIHDFQIFSLLFAFKF